MAPIGVSRDEQVSNPVFQLDLSVPYQYQSLSDSLRSTNNKLRLVLDCLVSDDEDCTTITNFYTCVDVVHEGQESGSGQGAGDGFEDIEDIDVDIPTSAVSNQSMARSSQPPTSGTVPRGGSVRMNTSSPTTSRGSAATRLNYTLLGDMNITVDSNDTTTTIVYSTALGSKTDVSQAQNSGVHSNSFAEAAICLVLLFHLLWISN